MKKFVFCGLCGYRSVGVLEKEGETFATWNNSRVICINDNAIGICRHCSFSTFLVNCSSCKFTYFQHQGICRPTCMCVTAKPEIFNGKHLFTYDSLCWKVNKEMKISKRIIFFCIFCEGTSNFSTRKCGLCKHNYFCNNPKCGEAVLDIGDKSVYCCRDCKTKYFLLCGECYTIYDYDNFPCCKEPIFVLDGIRFVSRIELETIAE